MIRGMAHRGYSIQYPENTIAAFEASLQCGFSHIELDVHLTRDDIPVVMHDPTVDRMTNGHGVIRDYTLRELGQLRIAEEEKIPTLEEVLLLLKSRAMVMIELKQFGRLYPNLEERVLDIVRSTDMMQEVFLSSFDHYAIERVRHLDPAIALGLVIEGASRSVFPFMKEIGARYLSVCHSYVTDAFMEQCRAEDIQPILWTVNDEVTMRKLALAYPDALICTDALELWVKTIAEVHRR
ncbi:glycerophosphodiester phosphodiesterase family protein [Paenibacillus sp. J5C_2022]|uniref:glycerophosphodiester phosphodiesterase n=1 Tax=Paenibacillus sp. J5C2022 TaxID=2977129 RepID=UPI0021CF1CCB|nr:glycerophosphodiester phosphodiesterase family protein [Paenibacillus sp. J5C2022]MCU6711746.1 glycerophosphodiester phosphodiesterase family protein [Paenibacillus sp. J5C2022]